MANEPETRFLIGPLLTLPSNPFSRK